MSDRFTDLFIKGLRPEPQREYVRRDPANQGFAIRVHPTGRKTWLFIYDHRQRRRKMTLGTYPEVTLREARQLYQKARIEKMRGDDPAGVAQDDLAALANTPTVQELASLYIERRARYHKKSWREDERLLNKDVIPRWRHRLISEISRRDVGLLLDAIAARGAPFSANGTQVVLSSMFNYAVEMEYLPANPAAGLKKRGKYRRRERTLTLPEIREFFEATRSAGTPPLKRSMYLLQLMTATRPGELRIATWDEFDFDAVVWKLDGVRTKNQRSHVLPLSSPALTLLKAIPRTSDPWLFPSPARRGPLGKYNQAATVRELFVDGVLTIERFTPHDLRRTASTQLAQLGVQRMVISKILNHLDEHQTAIYDRYTYMDEKREALEQWSTTLVDAVGDWVLDPMK